MQWNNNKGITNTSKFLEDLDKRLVGSIVAEHKKIRAENRGDEHMNLIHDPHTTSSWLDEQHTPSAKPPLVPSRQRGNQVSWAETTLQRNNRNHSF